jgi:hypothetical protein
MMIAVMYGIAAKDEGYAAERCTGKPNTAYHSADGT